MGSQRERIDKRAKMNKWIKSGPKLANNQNGQMVKMNEWAKMCQNEQMAKVDKWAKMDN